jgi:arabinofuranosyltransferase
VKRWGAALGAFALLFYFNAYVCDDAFITFRSVDNFVRGYGLRYNVAERVQSFTSPLFTLVFSVAYAAVHDRSDIPNPDRAYWTVLCLSFVISVLALWRLWQVHGGGLGFWAVFALLMSSQAFVTFTSSGLETPLTNLLIVLFFAPWLRQDPDDARGYAVAFACVGLALTTRLDLALIFGPATLALVATGWTRLGARIVGPIAVGLLPLAAWHLFSLGYYGFLLPNSYFAKVGIDAPASVVWSMGRQYLGANLRHDPVTLVVCAAAVGICWTHWRTCLAGVGIVLHLVYVVSIGGDFLGYRFFAPPFLVGTMIFVLRFEDWVEHVPRGTLTGLVAAAVAYSMLLPASPLRAMWGGPAEEDVKYYYRASGLARWRPGVRFPFARFLWVTDAAECRRLRTVAASVAVWGDGLNAFCRGPDAYLIDPHGITDGLMARVSPRVSAPFKPGHMAKALPAGYVESVRDSANRIADPGLAAFYGDLRQVIAGPLWTRDRWRVIWRLNFTAAARYRRPYASLPEIPRWMREDAGRGSGL